MRGLFVKHTRTGNPLVDSVAEHQPANEQAYQQYLHNVYELAYLGFGFSFLRWTDANTFVILYALIAYYFANRMARLVILLGPVASALGGIALGFLFDNFLLYPAAALVHSLFLGAPPSADVDAADATKGADADGTSQVQSARSQLRGKLDRAARGASYLYNARFTCVLRIAVGVYLLQQTRWPLQKKSREFYRCAHDPFRSTTHTRSPDSPDTPLASTWPPGATIPGQITAALPFCMRANKQRALRIYRCGHNPTHSTHSTNSTNTHMRTRTHPIRPASAYQTHPGCRPATSRPRAAPNPALRMTRLEPQVCA